MAVKSGSRSEVIEMMWYYGSGIAGWMWVLGTLMMLLFWGGLAVLVVWTVSTFTHRQGAGESAEEILKRRLAAGQISPDEYEKTRRTLQG
jgi:putative membrane protein